MQALKIRHAGHDYSIFVTKAEARPRTYRPGESREYFSQPRVYFWEDGETILDHLVNRRAEPYRLVRKALDSILQDLGVSFAKARWSQRAGCSCPCSPGFVLDGASLNGQHAFDVFLTIRIEGGPQDSASRQFDREAVSAG